MIESVSWGMGTPTESFSGRSASHRPAWCLSTPRLTSCFTERSRFFLFLFCSSPFVFCIFPYFSACLFFLYVGVHPYMKRKSNRNENRKFKKTQKKRKGGKQQPISKTQRNNGSASTFSNRARTLKVCVEKKPRGAEIPSCSSNAGHWSVESCLSFLLCYRFLKHLLESLQVAFARNVFNHGVAFIDVNTSCVRGGPQDSKRVKEAWML